MRKLRRLLFTVVYLVLLRNESIKVNTFDLSSSTDTYEIETYKMDKFPNTKVSLHMPCEESNMFATKCMCHIRCTSANCANARKICEKYYHDKGCRYMLLRGGNNKIATLKRKPTHEEFKRFDISFYPTSLQELYIFKQHYINSITYHNKPTIQDLILRSGVSGNIVIKELQKLNSIKNQPLCISNDIKASNYSDNRVDRENIGDMQTKILLQKQREEKFYNDRIALVVLNYHTPLTLFNTLRTWNSTGFTNMMSERLAVLNDPLPSEIAIALHHGFEVLQPKDIPDVKLAKPNVITIGAAFYYTLQRIKSEYVLFMEKDFKMDETLSVTEIQTQLITAAGLLDRGVGIVRLMSRRYQGCGTFKSCDHGGIHLDARDPTDRRRNWYAFYCEGHKGTEKIVTDCTMTPRFRCFTSWDSNWTLNAVMVKKSDILNKKYKLPHKKGSDTMRSIPEIGLAHYQNQDGFESAMVPKWMRWKVPICISYQGLFIHEEIETSA